MKKQTRGAPLIARILSLNIITTSVLLTGCATNSPPEPVSISGTYFDTLIQISLYDYPGNSSPILSGCLETCGYYEDLFSSTIEGSDIWNINHATSFPVEISPETATLISDAIDICDISKGRIDITLGEISSLWDFSNQSGSANPQIPSSEELNSLLSHVDYHNIVLSSDNGRNYISLTDPDTKLELGFIAKGYIADRLKDYLTEAGVESALINLGGNIYAMGSKPDGSLFTIAIQKPFDDRGEYISAVHVHDMSVVSSGNYERYFIKGDEIYHHILDPVTGFPIQNNISEVSIICPSSEMADALSTLCYVLGIDEGIEYIETLDNTECMYITSDYEVKTSSGWDDYK